VKVETREECSEALALMANVLREGEAFEAEYPLVFGAGSKGRVIVVEEEGVVRSTCAVLIRELITPNASLRVGMIGSVSTDPDHRGRGLATSAIEAAEEYFTEQGCIFSLLWADSEEFYLKRGYQRIGSEIDFAIGLEQLKSLPSCENVRIFTEDDLQQVHSLYTRHPERVGRQVSETASLLGTPGMEVLVNEDAGQIVAYACVGRGGDMANVIHEWGGEPKSLGACIHAHMKRRAMKGDSSDLYLIAPSSAVDLRDYLSAVGATSAPGVLGLGKLLDLNRLAELYSWFLGPDGGVRVDQRPSEVSPDGEAGLRIEGPTTALLLSANDAFRALFSPACDNTDLDFLRKELGLELEGLPITPFVWGLDSI